MLEQAWRRQGVKRRENLMEDLLVFLGLLFLGSFLFVFVAAIVLLVKTHLQSKRLAGLSLQVLQQLGPRRVPGLCACAGANQRKGRATAPHQGSKPLKRVAILECRIRG